MKKKTFLRNRDSVSPQTRDVTLLLNLTPSHFAIQARVLRIMSTFGSLFRVTTYGESHGASVGAIIDGMPPVGLFIAWDCCLSF